MREKAPYAMEAELCAAFIPWARREGWIVYPETADFDLLLVDKDGHQLGIEAKLRLNAKVIAQALPGWWGAGSEGPDYRGILIPSSGDAGFSHLLSYIGLEVFEAMRFHGCGEYLQPEDRFIRLGRGAMHDWNPLKRCELPAHIPDVAAGVPCPIRLTPWKEGALRVLAQMQVIGYITRETIREAGIDPRRWFNSDRWLEPIGNGQYVRGAKLPAFDEQHPDVFAAIVAEMRASGAKVAA